ncbi:MAG: uroporphyrinogen decarboxylase family protein [Armatimonadota bacterium]|jgi:uroporphyrinogen decarboxylase
MQTSREVIDNLLRGKPAERVGVMDGPWSDTLEKWVHQGYPADAEGRPVSPVDHFGYDLCGVGGWFDTMPLKGVSELVEETEAWAVRRNGAGAALKYWKHKSGTPEHIDFRMTSREVWERDYRPHLLEVDPERADIAGTKAALAARREQGLWTHYGHLFVWENMRQTMGDVCMYESLLLDPAWIHDYNRVYTDFFKAHYTLIFQEAGLPDGVWVYEDLGYRNGLFCSPKVLEELIFPYFRELIDFFHERNLPVVLHSCGNVTEALPLIVAAGFDALNPMEVKAGCDLFRFAEQYGDRLAFVGGLDARVLESGDRDLIRREVTRVVKGMKERGARYVFASDHSLSTNIDYPDYLFALEVYREHMLY